MRRRASKSILSGLPACFIEHSGMRFSLEVARQVGERVHRAVTTVCEPSQLEACGASDKALVRKREAEARAESREPRLGLAAADVEAMIEYPVAPVRCAHRARAATPSPA